MERICRKHKSLLITRKKAPHPYKKYFLASPIFFFFCVFFRTQRLSFISSLSSLKKKDLLLYQNTHCTMTSSMNNKPKVLELIGNNVFDSMEGGKFRIAAYY